MSEGGVDLLERPLEVLQNPGMLFDNVHSDDLDSLWASVEESATALSPWLHEFRIIGKDVKWKWVRGASNPTAMADGGIRWNGVMLNITEQKRAEEELRDTMLRQEAAVCAGDVGLWDWDLKTNRVVYSAEWKRQIGYEDHEISDAFDEWQTRVHPDDLDPLLTILREFIADKLPSVEVEFRFRHKDGSYRWILSRASLIQNENGHPIRVMGSHIDLTERRRAENALRESELRFRSVFDNAIVGVAVHEIMLDQKGCAIDYIFLQVNAAFERLTGLRHAEILGKPVTQFFPAEEASRFIAIYGKVVFTGIPVDFEAYSATLNRHFNISAYRVGVDRFATVFLDITDRVRAAESLGESEELFRKTFDEAPIGAAIVGLDHRFQRVNATLCRITGYEANELMARTFDDITHPDDLVADAEQAQKLADGVIDQYSMDKRYIRKDGTIAWVHLSVRLLKDQGGQPRGFLSMIVDISDRKQMETVIRDSEALLAHAEEIIGTGSFIWNVESDEFSSSNGLRRLYGLKEAEFPNTFRNVMLHLVHPQDQDRVRTEVARMVAERRAWPVEFRIVRSDDQERLIHCESEACLGTDDQAIRYVGTVQDITNRRADEIRFDAMQKQLHHTSRLAVMGEMAAGIAHEVNQPLCSIVNFAKACQNVAAQEPVDLDKIRQWTATINTAATRAGEIVHGLLRFARKHGPDWELTAVRELIEEAVLLVRHEAASHSVVLQTELPDEGLTLQVQSGQVQQVLVNLLRNGIEALSSIADRETRITVTATRIPDGVEISVADTGDGLPEKELHRLFETFYTTKPQGLGLGLAISRTIVEDHGGRIEAVINSSGGLTVQFTLPV